MDLEQRINSGDFKRCDIYIYNNKGDTIVHGLYSPQQIECYDKEIEARTKSVKLLIRFNKFTYDKDVDVFEFHSNGNEYMIMFS